MEMFFASILPPCLFCPWTINQWMTSCVNTEHGVTSQCCTAVQNTKTPQSCENCFGLFDFMSQWRKVTWGIVPHARRLFCWPCMQWWSLMKWIGTSGYVYIPLLSRRSGGRLLRLNFNQTHVRTWKNPIPSNNTGSKTNEEWQSE